MRLLALALIFFALPATAADIRVIDGDTFVMDGETIRLWGIDAPEIDQTCGAYRAGIMARNKLRDLVEDGPVTCNRVETDRYGRTIARCRNDRRSLAASLVSSGLARDWSRYSGGAYANYEWQAQMVPLGMWVHGCQAPWEWRRR